MAMEIWGGYDVYELLAEWNRQYIPSIIERMEREDNLNSMFYFYKNLRSDALYYAEHGELPEGSKTELRDIGIAIGCEDSDAAKLVYPIKITTRPCDYDDVPYSKTDPNQGCF